MKRRMRLVPFAILLTLAGGHAWAGDFSGFYAGVNAGTAFDRDRTAAGPRLAAPRTPGVSGGDLPPSAAGAAVAMQRPGRIDAKSRRR